VTSCGLAFTTSTELIDGGSFAFASVLLFVGAFAHAIVRQHKTIPHKQFFIFSLSFSF